MCTCMLFCFLCVCVHYFAVNYTEQRRQQQMCACVFAQTQLSTINPHRQVHTGLNACAHTCRTLYVGIHNNTKEPRDNSWMEKCSYNICLEYIDIHLIKQFKFNSWKYIRHTEQIVLLFYNLCLIRQDYFGIRKTESKWPLKSFLNFFMFNHESCYYEAAL